MFQKDIALDKSRLGELLVRKGLISQDQLQKALLTQRETGARLGEILLGLGWLSERQLQRALTRQKSYRYAIAVVAAVSAPLSPLLSAAAATVDEPAAAASVLTQRSTLKALDDSSMEQVSGQSGLAINSTLVMKQQSQSPQTASTTTSSNSSLNQFVQALTPNTQSNDAVHMAINAVKAVLPLQADVQINGMTFANGSDTPPPTTFQQDPNGGLSVNVAVPTHIDSIVFNNIQVQGQAPGSPTMGDLAIVGIDMHNTQVKVTMR